MTASSSRNIKREQKKSLFFRYISTALQSLTESEPLISKVFVSRIDFSLDCGICYIYCFGYSVDTSESDFDAALERLKLYKSSLRSSLAREIKSRYTPDLVFLYDKLHKKQQRIEELLLQVQQELSAPTDQSGLDQE